MDTFLLRVFQSNVLEQCKFIIFSYTTLNNSLTRNQNDAAFYSIQNLLTSSANISKILWGQKGKRLEERKLLRDSIGILDSSPLREVNMRNHFEHIDERIDRWWLESKRKIYIDSNIMSISKIHGYEDVELFKTFDPITFDVIFWGEKFNIRSIVKEVQLILPVVEAESRKPPWD